MGGKSVANRATSHWQRKRALGQRMKDYMEEAATHDKLAPSRDEIRCAACGFKARYAFARCPSCGEARG